MAAWEDRGNNTYRLLAFRGYGINGKKRSPNRKTIKITETMSEKKLHKYLDLLAEQFEREVQEGMLIETEKLTFEAYSFRFIEEYPANKKMSPVTLQGYRDYLIRINQAIGHIPLSKLRPEHLEEFYIDLSKEGVRKDGKYILRKSFYEQFSSNKKIISEAANINTRTINGWLKGCSTNLTTADKAAKAVGIPISKLFRVEYVIEGLAQKTILEHHKLIHVILKRAKKRKLIKENVSDYCDLPSVEKQEANYYDDEQTSVLLEKLSHEPLKYQAAVCLALLGGLRLGETVGLMWSDVNFDKSTLSIKRSRVYVRSQGSIDKAPKTPSSIRTLTLPKKALAILWQHKQDQNSQRLRMGEHWIDNNRILTQVDGKPMYPGTPSQWFTHFIRRHNLPHITFHQLRHTNIVLLLGNNTDVTTVSKRVGHAKVSTTLDVYSHAMKKNDTKAADTLDKIIGD